MYGIWSTAHAIGEGLTFVGVAALVTLWGWRAGFWGPGTLCIVVAFGLYLLMQDRPPTPLATLHLSRDVGRQSGLHYV